MFLDCDSCEKKWLFGEKGVCNVTTNTCECPEGYSGNDVIFHVPACYMDIDRVLIFYRVLTGMVGLASVVTTVCFFKLAYRWRHAFNPSSSSPASNPKNNSALTITESRRIPKPKVDNKTQKIKRNTLRMSGVMFIFNLLVFQNLCRHSFLRDGDLVNVQNSDFSFKITTFLVTDMTLAVDYFRLQSWYDSLPGVDRFGALFGLDSLLTEHALRIERSIFRVFVVGVLSSFITLVLLPAIDNGNEMYTIAIYALMVFSLLKALFYVSMCFILTNNMLKIYHLLLEQICSESSFQSSTTANKEGREKTVRDTIQQVEKMKSISIQTGVANIIFYGLIIGLQLKFQFIFILALTSFCCVGFALLSATIDSRTNGGLTPLPIEIQPLESDKLDKDDV